MGLHKGAVMGGRVSMIPRAPEWHNWIGLGSGPVWYAFMQSKFSRSTPGSALWAVCVPAPLSKTTTVTWECWFHCTRLCCASWCSSNAFCLLFIHHPRRTRSCSSGPFACVTLFKWRKKRQSTVSRGASTRARLLPATSPPHLMRSPWWRAWRGELWVMYLTFCVQQQMWAVHGWAGFNAVLVMWRSLVQISAKFYCRAPEQGP